MEDPRNDTATVRWVPVLSHESSGQSTLSLMTRITEALADDVVGVEWRDYSLPHGDMTTCRREDSDLEEIHILVNRDDSGDLIGQIAFLLGSP